MADQSPITTASPPPDDVAPSIELPPSFHFAPQDRRLNGLLTAPNLGPNEPPLGVLEHFKGKFGGSGFNLIFRPNSGETTFLNPLDPSLPAPPNPPNENVLELNLTTETISFSDPLGDVPNRGLEKQTDIHLNGRSYVQTVNDVTDIKTGKPDAKPSQIHIEPGLWMHVPATTIGKLFSLEIVMYHAFGLTLSFGWTCPLVINSCRVAISSAAAALCKQVSNITDDHGTDPVLGESLTRMASIPHGTTINAQCLAPTTSFPGPPPFIGANALPPVDITPFVIGNPGNKIRFAAQTASATNTPRLPQDLSKFIAAGTITQAILDNPNIVLGNSIKGQNITKTIVFTVSTKPTAPLLAGGTANIDFLQGSTVGAQSGPNASAVEMLATFWIEDVQASLKVPAWKHGDKPLYLKVPPAAPGAQHGPTFTVKPPHDIQAPITISVTYTQIQYMQTVFLNFAGLTWPHVSCATLVPTARLPVVDSAFPK